MSMATRTDTQSPALHVADSHDLIRVQGARENNLKDVSVELPKRRLTVFTGVSGSGKSSLVFGTIAAESQRLINETYSAFVQGFMPTLARPEVDVLDGLTTAIIVDQERMGANPRSTVGTATDANAMLRILFSRLGKPHIGSPNAYSFNVPSVKASGAITIERGGKTKTEKATFNRLGGMCPRCEGMGSVTDFDLSALYDDSLSLDEGALTIPGYSMDGWYGRIFSGAGFDMDKPIAEFTKKELHEAALRGADQDQGRGDQPDLRGRDPQDPEVDALQGRRGDAAAHPRLRGAGGDVHDLPRVRRHPAQQGGPVVEDQGEEHRRRLRDADQRPGRLGPGARRAVGGPAAHRAAAPPRLVRGDRAWDTSRSTGRRARCPGGEAQRTKMIRHLGSSLTDVTYVFDEPTIGLHPHDIQRMNDLLLQLRDKGNTVLVVEHKPETIAIADHVVDLGPGAGTAGGTVCFEGTVEGLRRSDTTTGRHLDDRATLKESVRSSSGTLEIRGASTHNLQDVDVDIPLGVLCVVTGVAGSGKSSLIHGSVPAGDGRGSDRPGRDPRLATEQPGDVHQTARPDPQGVREGQRREAGAVQRQLRGRLPHLQRRRRHLHRPGDDGRRRHPPARSARGSGSRHRCWSTTSAAATSARCSRCR